MSDCVPYAIHIATSLPMDTILPKAQQYGWRPGHGMQAVAGWCLIRDMGFEVTPMTAPEPKATVKQLLASLDDSKIHIVSLSDHWFAVRYGQVFDKGGTHPRTHVRHVFEVGPAMAKPVQTPVAKAAHVASQGQFDSESVQAFARRWLLGSTCHRQTRTIHWVSDDNRFVLMKHHGHTEYVDRVRGSARCGTWYGLYDLTNRPPEALGKPCLWFVEGRWLAAHWDELHRVVADAR